MQKVALVLTNSCHIVCVLIVVVITHINTLIDLGDVILIGDWELKGILH